VKRYPGIRPFTAEDQHLFYGRDEEQRSLFQMVILNEIVVLFGKSGTGKSSLLNAGVCPQFEDRHLHPVFIRLHNTNLRPEQQVYEYLKENDYIPKNMPDGLTLWEYFKCFWYVDLGEVFTPVIIFDQFEELFTLYTLEERQNFIDQLADLVNGRMPISLQKKIKESDDSLDPEIDWQTPPKVKIILAIRSDYLYLLNELASDIPSILRTRFQLNMLNRSNAIQAITLPALAAGEYESPIFEYEPKSLENIIEVLGKKELDQLRNDLPESEIEIEAFQLQLFSQQIENKIISENRPSGFIVSPGFFGGKEGVQKIIGDFYSSVVSRVPEEFQVAVETMAATFLIRNNRRIIMEESSIREECGIPQNLLDQLHEERLLRKEARTGNFYYEISHDTLIEPVLEKYQDVAIRLEEERQEEKRLVREKELAAITKKAEEERQRAEEQAALRQIAERNEKKARKRTQIAIIISILGLALAIFAGIQYKSAKEAKDLAITAQNTAEVSRKQAIVEKDKAKQAAEDARISEDKAKKAAEKARLSEDKAKEAAEKARISEAKAKQAAEDASISEDKAKEAAEEARINATKAKKAEEAANQATNDAMIAEKEAISALNNLQKANAETAVLLLKEVDQNILELDYLAASNKTEAVLLLKAKEEESLQRVQEIAFFYTESVQYSKAKEILASIEIDANEDLNSLRKLIGQIDKANFKSLEQRYYPEMVLISGGQFRLAKDGLTGNEFTQLDSFWLAKTETTVLQYNLYAVANNQALPEKSSWGRNGDHPIMGLSWFDAIAYTNWMSEQRGYPKAYILEKNFTNPNQLFDTSIDWTKTTNWEEGGYRLPTELEWEYAASGGSANSFIFSGSDILKDVGWSINNSGRQPHTVASKNNNLFGLYDMSGNAWEWCWDWYEDTPIEESRSSKKKNMDDPIQGISRVIRGGSWFLGDTYSQVTFRGRSIPNLGGSNYGFRCARSY